MNHQQIRQAITGIATLLGSNPALLAKELTGLKALLPGLDESAITGILDLKHTSFVLNRCSRCLFGFFLWSFKLRRSSNII